MKIKAMEEVYNDEPRVKCTVIAIEGLNYVRESEDLLEKIRLYLQ
jgi:hypothetical protein